jgi:hypothetical protein
MFTLPVTAHPHPSTTVIPPPRQSTDPTPTLRPHLHARQPAATLHTPVQCRSDIFQRCPDISQRSRQSKPRNGAHSMGVLGSQAESCLSLFSAHFTLLIHFHYLYDATGDLVAQNPPCVYIPCLSFEKTASLNQANKTRFESTVLPAWVLPVFTIN